MPGSRLAAADAVWFAVERPSNRTVVTAVLRLDGPVDLERLRRLVEDRLVAHYPRLSRRVVTSWVPWRRRRWVADPDFDVRRHVREAAFDGSDPTGCADARQSSGAPLQRLVGGLLGHPLDLAHPPWDLHVVPGSTGGAVIARFHHSLADGRALAEVLLRLTDDDGAAAAGATTPPTAAGTPPGADAGAPPSRRPAATVRQLVVVAAGVVRTLAQLVAYVGEPRTALRGRLGTAKRAAWTEPHDLDDVKRAADRSGASVNDVLLAALAGGLRRHAERLGDPPLDVRVVVPADLRAGAPVGHRLGNRFGLVLVRLPVSERDRSARVRAVVAATEAAKRSPQAVSTYVLLRLAGTLPRPVPDVAAALMGAGASAVVTNVPGPRQPLSLLGQPLRSVVFWVPQVGRIGVGVSIFSYAGTVTVGVAADAGLALDPAVLAADVDAEISALAAVSAPAGRGAP